MPFCPHALCNMRQQDPMRYVFQRSSHPSHLWACPQHCVASSDMLTVPILFACPVAHSRRLQVCSVGFVGFLLQDVWCGREEAHKKGQGEGSVWWEAMRYPFGVTAFVLPLKRNMHFAHTAKTWSALRRITVVIVAAMQCVLRRRYSGTLTCHRQRKGLRLYCCS